MPYRYGKDRKGRYVKWGRRGRKNYYRPDSKRSRAAAKAAAKRGRKR